MSSKGKSLSTVFSFKFTCFSSVESESVSKGRFSNWIYLKYLMKGKMKEYAESFTIHGLSRIAGGNWKEKIIWTIFVCTAITMAVYFITGYITKYNQHEIYQDSTKVKTKKMYFPSLTFCFRTAKEILSTEYQGNCDLPRGKWVYPNHRINNGIFIITSCFIGWYGHCDYNEKLIYFHEKLKHLCFTWQTNRTFFQTDKGIQLQFVVDDNLYGFNEISVTVHDKDIDPTFITPQIHISPERRYLLKLKKTITKRLPHPFPSNCTYKQKYHHFPGAYNREACLIMNRNIEIYKKYGLLSDASARYVLDAVKQIIVLPMNGVKLTEKLQNTGLESPLCSFACEETTYEVTPTVMELRRIPSLLYRPQFVYDRPRYKDKRKLCHFVIKKQNITRLNLYQLEIEFQNRDFYFFTEEKEVYPWDKMLGEIGGILGLMVGASALSFIEVFIYATISAIRKLLNLSKL